MQTGFNAFTVALLLVCVLAAATRLWLGRRHSRHVHAHRSAVPPLLRSTVSLRAHRKAADYTIARTRLGVVEIALAVAVVLAWTIGGGLELLDRGWRQLELAPALTGALVVLSVVAIGALVELPVDAWRTWRIEGRFGFNRMSPSVFVGDVLRQGMLLVLIGLPLLVALVWIGEVSGAQWWLALWAVWTAFTLFIVWAYPVLVAPLFNRFRALEDPDLNERVQGLLSRCGFPVRGIYVMDGSRRSAMGNAYFTGLGRHRRIVFFDTLLDLLPLDEVEAVLAHEVAHYRLRHVQRRIATLVLLSLLAFALLGWATTQPGFFAGLGVATPSLHLALALLLVLSPTAAIFVQPWLAAQSRRQEYEADAWAARQVGAEPLVSALGRLYRDNSTTLTPDPLYSAFHDTHPPALVRLARLASLDAGRETLSSGRTSA